MTHFNLYFTILRNGPVGHPRINNDAVSYTHLDVYKRQEEDIEIYNTILNDVKTAMTGLRLSHDAVVPVLGTQLSYLSLIHI